VEDASGEVWRNIDAALNAGLRGLPGGSSLARLLAAAPGKRNNKDRPRLSEQEILAWARAFHARHGRWPKANSGPVVEAPGETWSAINAALIRGLRGLPGGESLYWLLLEYGLC
jgi:hypothetical protein